MGSVEPKRTPLEGWDVSRLHRHGNRAHFNIDGRYISVVLHQRSGRVYALDSPCYHAAGPLGEGPVVDIEDIPCIRCPWHNFLVALDTGEEVTVPMRAPDFGEDGVYRPPTFPLQPVDVTAGPPQRGPRVQRMHRVGIDERTGELFVEVEPEEALLRRPLRSDCNARHEKRGGLSMEIYKIKQMEKADPELR